MRPCLSVSTPRYDPVTLDLVLAFQAEAKDREKRESAEALLLVCLHFTGRGCSVCCATSFELLLQLFLLFVHCSTKSMLTKNTVNVACRSRPWLSVSTAHRTRSRLEKTKTAECSSTPMKSKAQELAF